MTPGAAPADEAAPAALIGWDLVLSAEQVRDQVDRLAARLRVVAGGRPVAVMAKNSGRTLITYLATILSGSPLVPLSALLRASEVEQMLEDAEVAVLLVGPELGEVAQALRTRTAAQVLTWGDSAFEAWLEGPSVAERPDHRVNAPTVFSSGTTGRPKRTQMPRSLFPRGATLEEYRRWTRTNRLADLGPHLVCGPLYHSGPFQATALLAAGVTVHVPRRFEAAEVLETIHRERIATSLMVPTHFVRLLRARDEAMAAYDVSSVRLVTQTGAGCPEEVKRAMIAWWGPVFLETYGGTESGGVCAITSPEWLERPNSVGRTLPGYRALVVDDDGQEVGPGVTGKLYFEDLAGWGIEYADEPELTAAAHLRPGVFTLGEIGHVDADGYVFITDRDSDKVVSGGVNVYPAEAERVLREHPAVVDAVVFGIPNDEMGEELLALVVATGDGPSEEALIAFCRDRLATVKVPRRIRVVDALTRSAMGKVNRRQLREEYLKGVRA
jgi:long-chain acyl-CoA synthetase